MFIIENTETGEQEQTSEYPRWANKIWLCGDKNFIDATGTLYQPIGDPPPDPLASVDYLIDIGPFFDRFEPYKMAILTSADAIVQGVVKDCMARKWVDLRLAAVGAGIDALISKGVCNAPTKVAVLHTPVLPDENMALRIVYFS